MSERADQCAPMFLCSSEHFRAQKFIAEFVTMLRQIHRWIVLSLCLTIHRWIVGPSLKLVVTKYYEFEFTAELSDHHNHHAWADSPLNCPEPVSDNSPVNFCLMTSHAPIGWQICPKRIAEAKPLHCNGFWRERGQCSGGTKMNFENFAYRRR